MIDKATLDQLMAMRDASNIGKENLDNIVVEGSSGSGLVKLKMDGNYNLKELKLATDIKTMEVEDLEDFLSLALRNAIEEVNKQREKEMLKAFNQLF